MNKRELSILLICNLLTWWPGMGLMPLLPIYAARLGATPALVGNYLSFCFLALTAGTVCGGWVSAKLQQRRLPLVLISLAAAPLLWAMGQVSDFWQLVLLTAAVWFAGGASITLIGIIAGMYTSSHQRGRVFGALSFVTALAGVAGGASGFIADHMGYPALCAIMAFTWLVQALAASLLQEKKALRKPGPRAQFRPRLRLSSTFFFLTNFVFSSGAAMSNYARSWAMDIQGLNAAAITATAAIGSCAGLVFSPLLGYLSDHLNRRILLAAVYACGGLALILLLNSTTLIGFALVALLIAIGGSERAVAPALVADLTSQHALDQGISLFESARWIGSMLGFTMMGYAIQLLGLQAALWLGVCCTAAAIVTLLLTRWKSRDKDLEARDERTALAPSP